MNQETIEKIKEFYNPQLDHNTICIMVNGQKRYISLHNKRDIFLSFGEKISSEEEAIQKGIFKTNAKELFMTLFPEEWEKIKHKYEDTRTDRYLEACKRNIGLVDYKNGWEEEKLINKKEYSLYLNANPLEIGQNESGQWVAQIGYRTDIDDYNIERIYFNKKPSINDVKIARTIDDIEHYFIMNGYDKSVFRCWECGRKVHWLDNENGNVEEKFERLKEEYCGC